MIFDLPRRSFSFAPLAGPAGDPALAALLAQPMPRQRGALDSQKRCENFPAHSLDFRPAGITCARNMGGNYAISNRQLLY